MRLCSSPKKMLFVRKHISLCISTLKKKLWGINAENTLKAFHQICAHLLTCLLGPSGLKDRKSLFALIWCFIVCLLFYLMLSFYCWLYKTLPLRNNKDVLHPWSLRQIQHSSVENGVIVSFFLESHPSWPYLPFSLDVIRRSQIHLGWQSTRHSWRHHSCISSN